MPKEFKVEMTGLAERFNLPEWRSGTMERDLVRQSNKRVSIIRLWSQES